MNILYLINELQLGGSQLGAIKEIKELSNRGHKITVVARDGGLKPQFINVSDKVEIVTLPIYGLPKEIKSKHEGVKINIINFLRAIRRLRFIRSIYSVKNIVARDKIHVIYACQPGPCQVAHVVSKITKKPFVIRIQHILSNEFPPLFHRKVVNDSFMILVITHEIKEHIINNYFVADKKIEIIPTCIELDNYMGAKKITCKDERNSLGIQDDDIVIVSIATHREDKMIPIISLVDSAEKLYKQYRGLKCILVGDGPYQDQVERLAKEVNLKLGENIILPVGRKEDLNPYLAIADLGIGVGRCAMEFLASGNALICASHQAFGGLFTEDRCGDIAGYNFSGRNTSEKSNPENVYNAIKEYIDMDAEEKSRIKKFGQEFIISKYGTQNIIDKTEQILYKAIQNK